MQLEEQVRVPQFPHVCVEPGEHVPSPVQLPHEQLEEQVRLPQFPHVCVAPGEHAPSPRQLPHEQLEEQVRVPQFPHACDVPGEQTPSPVHPPHVFEEEHVRVPQLPQDSVSPGVHSPSSTHTQEPHVQPDWQVLSSCPPSPQLPPLSTWPGQQRKPLSQAPSQSSSSPLQDSAGGVQAEPVGLVQPIWQIPEPVDPQVVVQSTVKPRAQS